MLLHIFSDCHYCKEMQLIFICWFYVTIKFNSYNNVCVRVCLCLCLGVVERTCNSVLILFSAEMLSGCEHRAQHKRLSILLLLCEPAFIFISFLHSLSLSPLWSPVFPSLCWPGFSLFYFLVVHRIKIFPLFEGSRCSYGCPDNSAVAMLHKLWCAVLSFSFVSRISDFLCDFSSDAVGALGALISFFENFSSAYYFLVLFHCGANRILACFLSLKCTLCPGGWFVYTSGENVFLLLVWMFCIYLTCPVGLYCFFPFYYLINRSLLNSEHGHLQFS